MMEVEKLNIMAPVPLAPPRFWQAETSINCLDVVSQDIQGLLIKVDDLSLSLKKLKEKTDKDRADLLLRVIEIDDALERVITNADQRQDESGDVLKPMVGNLHTIILLLRRLLSEQGIAPIEPADNLATPGDHFILDTRITQEFPEYYILETVEKGYRLNEEVLRKAKVITSVPG